MNKYLYWMLSGLYSNDNESAANGSADFTDDDENYLVENMQEIMSIYEYHSMLSFAQDA